MLDRLVVLPLLAEVPREQLQWLIDHGEVLRVTDGTPLRGTGADPRGLFLIVSGRLSHRTNQGGVEREVQVLTAGHVTGSLPYSRMTTPRGYLIADGPVELLLIKREDMREMTRECYEFTAMCVQEMLARARVFKAEDKRQEKMAALGRLSAGLAHELNNPTSAAARAVQELDAALGELAAAARDLGAAGLTGGAQETLRALESVQSKKGPASPLERVDLEDRLMDWLEDRGLDGQLAYSLIGRGLTVEDLDTKCSTLSSDELSVVLRYLASDYSARALTADIATATERIHSLVSAVKKHTHMDRAPTSEPTRIEEHLADTVTLMSGKAAQKGASLKLHVEEDLPMVEASVAELNQVWMHLVDNAIDAVGDAGHISIDARRDQNRVVVRVIDDGPGIREELQERVFEPFFTTKDVGEGRGLGLDIVQSVVRDHRGTVDLTSIPGRTEFRVMLPIVEPNR